MNRREFTQLGAVAAATAMLPACMAETDDPLGSDPGGSSLSSASFANGGLASGAGPRAFAADGRSFKLAPLRNYFDAFDANGRRVARVGNPNRPPTTAVGDVSGPVAAAWNESSGRLLVLERGNARVQAFGPSGASLGVVAAVGPASDLALDARDGTIYVAASSSHCIQVLSAGGAAVRTLGHFGTDGAGLNGPVSVDLSPDGALHVVDAGSASVKVFTPDGGFVGSYGDSGGDSARLVGPRAIRFDAKGRAWVADTFGAVVRVYSSGGRLLSRVLPRLADGRRAAPVALSLRDDGTMYAAVVAAA